MEFIFWLGGLIMGILIEKIIRAKERIHGVIHIDHDTKQCSFRITSNELSNRKTKMVTFYVNHDAFVDENVNSQE